MKYEYLRYKGQGGYGIVEIVKYKNQEFAKKTFRLSPLLGGDTKLEESSKKRFIKEAKLQRFINHKNIVPVLDADLNIDPPYYIMPVAQATLDEDKSAGRIHKGNCIDVINDIMAGLEEIHNVGIFHRDLKPSNVLRLKGGNGEEDYYAISDFGLMSMKETSVTTITSTGSTRNSDYYSAPEIVADLKAASIQSDIYSLGCIIHDFVGENPDRIPLHEIHDTSEFSDILSGCTKEDPKRRFKSIASLRDALSTVTINPTNPTSKAGSDIIKILEAEESFLEKADIERLFRFLSSGTDQQDKISVLTKINLEDIEQINNYDELKNQIALTYAKWVRKTSFAFAFCDTICSRTMKLIENGNVNIQAEGLMALLYMGTSHNRYFVENRVHSYLNSSTTPEGVLKRLAMEIRIDENEVVDAFDHLSRSIGINLKNLPVIIQNSIDAARK